MTDTEIMEKCTGEGLGDGRGSECLQLDGRSSMKKESSGN